MREFLHEAFSGTFLVRLAAATVVAGIVAGGEAFAVADYVAKSNVNTISERISGVDSRISQVDQRAQDQMAATRTDLLHQIEALIGRLDETNQNLGGLTETVGDLASTVDTLNQEVKESVARRVEFERFVTSILIRQPPPQFDRSAINASWGVDLSEDELQRLGISPEEVEYLLQSFE